MVANCDHLKKLRFSPALPYAFTEHGAIMAATVLNSARAIQVSLYVVEAFVRLRDLLSMNRELEHDLVRHQIHYLNRPGVDLRLRRGTDQPTHVPVNHRCKNAEVCGLHNPGDGLVVVMTFSHDVPIHFDEVSGNLSVRILLNRDLANLYGVETRLLNQAVRRNLDRFPDDFMFSLAREEIRNISRIVICSSLKHARNVFAFTEQGVAMLSSVLNSPRAVQVNIEIMRAFVRLREQMATNQGLGQKLAELERRISSHDEEIQAIFEAIHQLVTPPEPPRKEIGFHVKDDGVPYQ